MLKTASSASRTLIGTLAMTVAIGLPAHAIPAPQTRAQLDAAYNSPQQQSALVTTSALTADTRSCEVWYFGTLGSKCLRYGSGTLGVGYAGAMGNQAPNCPTIPVGQVTTAVTAPTGGSSCFQFVTSGSVTMPLEVSLPSNVTGIAELFVIYPNGGGFKLTEARTGTPLAMNFAMSAAQRIGLVIRPFSGPGGQNMNIGVNVAAPTAPTALNDTAANATGVPMNRGVSSTLAIPGSSNGYYFYPLDAGETAANYNIARTANQTVGVRSAQMIAPGTYTMGTETIVPVSASGVTNQVTSANSNAAGSTTPFGYMVRVSATNASAPADEPYSVRMSGGRNYIFQTTTANTESITRLYPSPGQIQVATYLTVSAKIKDALGNFVPNEPVQVIFRPNLDVATTQILNGVTDEYGYVTITANFPACSGSTYQQTYATTSSPPDRWKGYAQFGTVNVSVAIANPPAGYFNNTTIPFTRICSETYLGH